MRAGGGKSKGGGYEHTIINKLASAFKPLGIQPDDCYRTKNSGATKSQPGDIQLSPKFAELLPLLIECKHYRSVSYKLGKALSAQPKSYAMRVWWQQVQREQKQRKDKIAVLVFRQNNCDDLICLKYTDFVLLCRTLETVDWYMFTSWKTTKLVMLPFNAFLEQVVDKIKISRIISKRKNNAQHK